MLKVTSHRAQKSDRDRRLPPLRTSAAINVGVGCIHWERREYGEGTAAASRVSEATKPSLQLTRQSPPTLPPSPSLRSPSFTRSSGYLPALYPLFLSFNIIAPRLLTVCLFLSVIDIFRAFSWRGCGWDGIERMICNPCTNRDLTCGNAATREGEGEETALPMAYLMAAEER